MAQHSAVGIAEDDEDMLRLRLEMGRTRRFEFGAVETRGVAEDLEMAASLGRRVSK